MDSRKGDLRLIVEAIKKEIKNNLVSIILFGSIAKGKPSKKSDYDILVVTKKYPKHDWKLAGKIRYSLLGRISRSVDIIFQDMEDLSYASPFLYEVYQGNKLLYGRKIMPKLKKVIEHIKPLFEGGKKIGWQIA